MHIDVIEKQNTKDAPWRALNTHLLLELRTVYTAIFKQRIRRLFRDRYA